jgi:hypothetical protein
MAGAGRSGSTILGNVLGQIPGFFYGGELTEIGRKSLKENRLCGFNVPLRDSEVWRQVLEGAFGSLDQAEAELCHEGTFDPLRNWRLLSQTKRQRYLERRRELLPSLAKLYTGIDRFGGGRVVVDSSHVPLYAYLLDNVPELELYVIHLIRDPRAVAFSWQRQKVQPDPNQPWKMRKHPVSLAATMWCASQIMFERIWQPGAPRVLRLLYEDFVAEPRAQIARILEFVGEPDATTPFVSDHEVNLEPTPCVFGNPDRFRLGRVALRSDDEWTRSMRWLDKTQVTSMCWPWLWKYGYLSAKRRPATASVERDVPATSGKA